MTMTSTDQRKTAADQMETTIAPLSDPDLKICSEREQLALMTLPLEIREAIYQYFLKIDADLDVLEGPQVIDMTLLQICRPMRDEVLDYLLCSNLWTRLTSNDNEVDITSQVKSLLHLPTSLFGQDQRERMIARPALHIQVCNYLPQRKHTATASQADFLVFHNVGSRVMLPKILIPPFDSHGLDKFLTLTINLVKHKQHVLEDLLLALTTTRSRLRMSTVEVAGTPLELAVAVSNTMQGKNTSFKHYYEHMLALIEEGSKLRDRGHLVGAAAYYFDGLRVFESYQTQTVLLKQKSPARDRAICSLGVDLAAHFAMVSDFIISRSHGDDGILLPASIHHIALMIEMRNTAFANYNMSDKQRMLAHYIDAVAMLHLANYLSIPGYREYMLDNVPAAFAAAMDRSVDDLREDATASYFYSWQVDVNHPCATMAEDHYRGLSYQTGFYMWADPLLASVDGTLWYKETTWTGDPSLVEKWTVQAMKSGARVEQVTDNSSRTEEHLTQILEKLGVRQSQRGGLTRLLGLGTIEAAGEETAIEDETLNDDSTIRDES